jgi:hypothetical protein
MHCRRIVIKRFADNSCLKLQSYVPSVWVQSRVRRQHVCQWWILPDGELGPFNAQNRRHLSGWISAQKTEIPPCVISYFSSGVAMCLINNNICNFPWPEGSCNWSTATTGYRATGQARTIGWKHICELHKQAYWFSRDVRGACSERYEINSWLTFIVWSIHEIGRHNVGNFDFGMLLTILSISKDFRRLRHMTPVNTIIPLQTDSTELRYKYVSGPLIVHAR